MKRKFLDGLRPGSAAYVIAHAKLRAKRGRCHPSMAYKGEKNPEKALALAKEDRNMENDRIGYDFLDEVYEEFPGCPFCNEFGRVGFNYIGGGEEAGGDKYYCYICCTTFTFGIDPGDTNFPENSWGNDEEAYDESDKGMGYLRYLMESVKPKDVKHKDFLWCAGKYNLLCASILGGLFSSEFMDEPTHIFGRYMVEIEAALEKEGIEFDHFHGLTQKGWGKVKELKALRPEMATEEAE